MNQATQLALCRLNETFYREAANAFSAKRQYPWAGWRRLREALGASEAFDSVLDVGSGNGRFAAFLLEEGLRPSRYVGVERSVELIEIARAQAHLPSAEYVQADVLSDRWLRLLQEASFSLIVVFGVLHHVPGQHERLQLLSQLAGRLSPDGVLVATFWRFADHPRLRRRILPWPTDMNLDVAQLEPGDHLLSWSEGPAQVRYCHHTSDEELSMIRRQLTFAGLSIVAEFDADGPDQKRNRYVVLRRDDSKVYAIEESDAESEPGIRT